MNVCVHWWKLRNCRCSGTVSINMYPFWTKARLTVQWGIVLRCARFLKVVYNGTVCDKGYLRVSISIAVSCYEAVGRGVHHLSPTFPPLPTLGTTKHTLRGTSKAHMNGPAHLTDFSVMFPSAISCERQPSEQKCWGWHQGTVFTWDHLTGVILA